MMKKNEKFAFLEEPSRQSGIAIGLILLRFLKTMVRQFWPILLVILFNPKKNSDFFWVQLIGGLGAFAAVRSIVAWFKFYYYVKDDELVIEKGVLQKSKLNIPIDRIQTVNFKQGVLHQIFDVVSVEIDTAGSTGNEFSIQAISKQKAVALRDFVESQKRETAPTQISSSPTESEIIEEKPHQELILQLTAIDLLKIGISQNHLRTAGLIFAFGWGFIDDIENAFNLKFLDKIENWITGDDGSWFFVLLIGIPFFFFVSFFITLISSVLRDFDLKFWRTQTGFKIVSGLFDKKEQSANLQKIQFLKWSSTPLKRLFGLFSLRLSQAASVAISRKNSIQLPGCYEPQITAVRRTWFPSEEFADFEPHNISKLVTWRSVLYRGIVPTGILILIFWSNFGFGALWWLLLIPVVYIWSQQYYKTWIYELSEDGLRASYGVITRKHYLIQWYKIQGVSIRQSIYQRRKSLSDLIFYTAAGAVSVPYIELEKAEMIRDFVLYKVEIDNRDWM